MEILSYFMDNLNSPGITIILGVPKWEIKIETIDKAQFFPFKDKLVGWEKIR